MSRFSYYAASAVAILVIGLAFKRASLNDDTGAAHFGLGSEACTFDVPASDVRITFARTRAHPFLAEYSRKVVATHAGNEGKPHMLIIDTGTGTDVNVYVIEQGGKLFIRLDDAHGDHLLDIDRDKMYLIVRVMGRVFLGELFSEHANVAIGMGNNDLANLEVSIDRIPALRAESILGDTRGRFLGVITGPENDLRFYSSLERSEHPVDKLGDDDSAGRSRAEIH